ncbi:MAG: low molecular weight protein arginine phosphatase [Candidatus Synoicihabitans palmerolidicus]|nr:low molecular weight protein arginine phosphatase [Candidatus Synoicihabitans palmerolidicus]
MSDSDPGFILAVCTGNICRSPMAEALLAHAFAAESGPLAHWKVASAGVSAGRGSPASANSVTAMKKVGLNISTHRSQPLTPKLLSSANAVFVMTESHRAIIEAMFDPTPRNVFLLREFLPSNVDHEIGDPYDGPLPEYEAYRDEIVEAIPSVMAFLRKELG